MPHSARPITAIVIFLLLSMAAGAPALAQAPLKVSVAVAKSSDGFTAPNAKDLEDSAADVRRSFAAKKVAARWVVVPESEPADVRVTVIGRGQYQTGAVRDDRIVYNGQTYGNMTPLNQNNLTLSVLAGGHEELFYGIRPGEHGVLGDGIKMSWGALALAAVFDIDKWAQANRARIEQQQAPQQ